MKTRNILMAFIYLSLSYALSGCTTVYLVHQYKKKIDTEVTEQSSPVIQGDHARVRFLGQAVIDIGFYRNQACYGAGNIIKASNDGIKGALGSKKNISIGMPITSNVTKMKERDGFFAKAFYREYAVAASEPLTISASTFETTGRTSAWCRDMHISFVPQQNTDYEVTYDINKGDKYCRLNIMKIEQEGSEISLVPVSALKMAPACKGT